MRTSLCLLALALGVAGVAGCGEKKSPPSGSSGSGSGSGSAAATGVAIFVDSASVATITADKVAAWPRLDSLVPDAARKIGTWDVVELAGPAPGKLEHPSVAYPDMVPALFPSSGPDAGGISFGMFDPVELAKKGKPAMHVDHLTSVRIKLAQGGSHGQNDDQGGGNSDPTKLVLTVKSSAGTTQLAGDKLLALPREPSPINPDQKGWRLQSVLGAAGITKFKQLTLTDASGANLTLDPKDLGADAFVFIKLNKQGQLRLRLYRKQGEGWNPAGDLRALTTIEAN